MAPLMSVIGSGPKSNTGIYDWVVRSGLAPSDPPEETLEGCLSEEPLGSVLFIVCSIDCSAFEIVWPPLDSSID